MAKQPRLVDSKGQTLYRFSFGPWNVHEGADPFGPEVRGSYSFDQKLRMYKDLGFAGVQFHDDDAVPELDSRSAADLQKAAKSVRKKRSAKGA